MLAGIKNLLFGTPKPVMAWHTRGSGHVPPGMDLMRFQTLPAGNYLVWVTIDVLGDDGEMVADLVANGVTTVPVGYTANYSSHSNVSGRMSITTLISMAQPGALVVRVGSGLSAHDSATFNGEMTALKVDTVNSIGTSNEPGGLN